MPDAIDFQPIIDEWVESVGGNRSVIIYDLERDEMAGNYNTDEDYNEFKAMVEKRNFTYDRQSEEVLKKLKEFAEFEG